MMYMKDFMFNTHQRIIFSFFGIKNPSILLELVKQFSRKIIVEYNVLAISMFPNSFRESKFQKSLNSWNVYKEKIYLFA